VIFNDGIAGVAEKYLTKGSKIALEGSLQTRKWTDQSGVERYSTEVVIKPYGGSLIMLDGKPGQSSGQSDYQAPQSNAPDLDDEIPF